MTKYLDVDELETTKAENRRIAELKARRDYWMLVLSHGKHETVMNNRAMFYVDYLDYLLQIPF